MSVQPGSSPALAAPVLLTLLLSSFQSAAGGTLQPEGTDGPRGIELAQRASLPVQHAAVLEGRVLTPDGAPAQGAVVVSSAGNWAAGDIRHFQVWYRDPLDSPWSSGFNATNGYSVAFVP